MKTVLTQTERAVIDGIGDARLNADYVQRWINEKHSSFYASEIAEAAGFYWAVHRMVERGMVGGAQ